MDQEALQASVQLLDQYKQGSLGPSVTNKQVCSFPVYISVVNMFMKLLVCRVVIPNEFTPFTAH